MTSQKKDTSDPKVMHDFAHTVGDQTHLDHLYLLTVADVRGTNPKLWNSWKASLFEEFYERTKRALRRGLESPIDQDELIAETQSAARELLAVAKVSPAAVQHIWKHLTDTYFLRHTPEEIAWHTERVAQREAAGDDSPLVSVQQRSERGGTAIFTYTPHRQHSFARTTAVLDQLGLNILDARIVPTANGYSIETYVVLEGNGGAIVDAERIREIENALRHNLDQPDGAQLTVTRRAPRQVRLFATATQVNLSHDARNDRTIVEIITGDRPGLLSVIGRIFMHDRVDIHGARIVTVGERAEDVFYVTGEDGRPLAEPAGQQLAARIVESLDRRG